MRKIIALFWCSFILSYVGFSQGSYAPTVGDVGTTAIFKDSTAIERWADSCWVIKGWQDIADTTLGLATYGSASAGIGSVDNSVVSLGDGGVAVLKFNTPISNIEGADFAVFENSFSNTFLELALVEVSSDGINFFRFDAFSETDTAVQIAGFGDIDPTNIYNLAGKYRSQYGTPFDLEELNGTAGLNINAITHIKLIDVIGTIDTTYATKDSEGRIINDPYPTPFESSGFDLDAVAVLRTPPALGITENSANSYTVYPNPTAQFISLNLTGNIVIYNSFGKKVLEEKTENNSKIDISFLPKGVYFIEIKDKPKLKTQRLLKI